MRKQQTNGAVTEPTTASETSSATAISAPVAVERPAEFASAVAFRDAVAKFNEGTLTRTTLTEADHAALDELEELRDAYAEEARVAWLGNAEWGRQNVPGVVTGLHEMLNHYRVSTAGTVKLDLVSSYKSIETPAIESSSVRNALARAGDEIVQQIDAAIAAGFLRITDARKEQGKLRAKVAHWLAIEGPIRSLVVALLAVCDANTDLMGATGGVLDSIRACQGHLVHEREREGLHNEDVLFIHGGSWKKWLPVARELLAEGDSATGGNAA